MRPRTWLTVVIGVVLVAMAAAGVVVLASRDGGPSREAKAYLGAWSRLDYEAMRRLALEPSPGFVGEHEAMTTALQVVSARFSAGEIDRDGGQARASFTAKLALRGLGEWDYRGSLRLVRRDDQWRVDWSPATLHPELRPGLRLARRRDRPPRAPILGVGDQPLTRSDEVISVGVEPGRVRDRAQAAAALARHAGVEPGRLEAALNRPGVRPEHFVPLAELRPERYAMVRPRLAPVPGVVFRRKLSRTSPGEGFARHVLGGTGEVTAERLRELGVAYQPGDDVGLSGLEAVYERELAGSLPARCESLTLREPPSKSSTVFRAAPRRPCAPRWSPPPRLLLKPPFKE